MTLLNLNIYNLAALFLLNAAILISSVRILVEAANFEVRSKYFVLSVILFVLSFLPLQILAEIGTERLHIAKVFIGLPLRCFIIYNVLLCGFEIIFAINFSKTISNTIGKNSIKESMDNLPEASVFRNWMARRSWSTG